MIEEKYIETAIGGLNASIFDHPIVINYFNDGNFENGGGYIGRWQERNVDRDRHLYEILSRLNMGDDFVAMFLTSRVGRWYAEKLGDLNENIYSDNKYFKYLLGLLIEENVITCKYSK